MSEALEPEDQYEFDDEEELSRSFDSGQPSELTSRHQDRRLSARYEYQSQFVSPFPPPSIMKGYEEASPGSAERLMVMAEKEQAHQHSMQEKLVNAQTNDLKQSRIERRNGQYFGFLIGMTAIIFGGYIVLQGKQVAQQIAGGFFGTTGVVGLVSVFVIGRRDQASQNQENSVEEE
jgi:uncharacterized membrane protein